MLCYNNVAYRDALWWEFAWDGDASRFLRASLVVAFVLVAISLGSVLSNRNGSRQGAEKSFALGGFEETYVSNFDHAVLRDETGKIVAFANLFQSGGTHELSLDLMRYLPGDAGFAMDALFAEMMLWGAAQGFHWFSLGSAPFSGIDNCQLASFWNRVGGFVHEQGEQFYHLEGLRSFKQKFKPVWEPNDLASPGGMAVPRILYEMNVLVSGGIRGLVK